MTDRYSDGNCERLMHLHYLDDDLLVVEKPAGMLSVPGVAPSWLIA